MNIAQSARQVKAAHPERYCSDPRCLWRVETRNGVKPCPKHMSGAEKTAVRAEGAAEETRRVDGGEVVGPTARPFCAACDGTMVHCVECRRCTNWLLDGLCKRCAVDI